MPFDNCSTDQKKALKSAYDIFIAFDILTKKLPELKKKMEDKWKNGTFECGTSCTGSCKTASGDCLDGASNSRRVLICTFETNRIGPVLLHELVHYCGGSELDSEAIEHACYVGNGATAPFGNDWTKFCNDTVAFNGTAAIRVADFVIWDSTTGEVWEKTMKDGSVIKGPSLFKSSNFIRPHGACK